MPILTPRSWKKYRSLTIIGPRASVEDRAKAAMMLIQRNDVNEFAMASQMYQIRNRPEAKTNTRRFPM